MRPHGEVRRAIVDAMRRAVDEGGSRGVTVRELAEISRVGMLATRRTVENLVRHGVVEKVAQRAGERGNRPVAEYALVEVDAGGEVERVMRMWCRR